MEIPENFENQVRKEYENLTKTLISKNITITTMESATSGQIASLITDTEGASAIFKGAYVTYSNEAKIMAGVAPEIIEKYSVYSKQTAEAMAEASRKRFSAEIGIGVTGTMGNADPANREFSKPGEVYFSISTKTQTLSWLETLPPQKNRLNYKLQVAKLILEKLNPIIENL